MEMKHLTTKSLYEFFIHVIVGTVIFIILAIPFVALNYLVKWLEKTSVDYMITFAIEFLQYSIIIIDFILFIIFLTNRTIHIYKSSIQNEK